MSERTLAHILYQCAKMLVSLLEKEFGFRSRRRVEAVTSGSVVGPESSQQIYFVDERETM